jgi:hypothetical protein
VLSHPKVNNAAKCVGCEFSFSVTNLGLILSVPESWARTEEQSMTFRTVWSSSAPASTFVSCCAPVDFPLLGPNRNSHISPFLFTKTLLPVMKKTALEPGSDVRIVNVCAANMGDGIPQLIKIGILGGAPVGTQSAV